MIPSATAARGPGFSFCSHRGEVNEHRQGLLQPGQVLEVDFLEPLRGHEVGQSGQPLP